MHFRNGREARNGDKVLVVPSYGTPYVGILYDAKPGSNYCNGKLAIPTPSDPVANLADCLHIDDAAEAFAPKPEAKAS